MEEKCPQCQIVAEELHILQARLQTLIENSPIGIFFDDTHDQCIFVNATFCQMTGLTSEEARGAGWTKSVHPEDLSALLCQRACAVQDSAQCFCCEYRLNKDQDKEVWVQEQTRPVYAQNGALLGYVGCLLDISARKQTELSTQKRSFILEERVRERTTELLAQSRELQEMNSALRVLLRQREADKKELEESVLANIRHQVLPCIDHLDSLSHSPKTREVLQDMRRLLQGIIDPFCRHLGVAQTELTPMEMRVAECIRAGLGTKAIAARLHIGSATVESHRHQIRRKFGLIGKRVHLQTFLNSLGQ